MSRPTSAAIQPAPDAHYTGAYYDAIVEGSLASARVVVPMVIDLVRPRSVIDIGCGTGAWLSEFGRAGVNQMLGIDGDYVNRSRLLIPRECFVAADVQAGLPDAGRFDLAVCLEVGEHIRPEASDRLVAALCRAAPVVMFSAAIPYQGGEGHINEQWQTFWYELFKARGYHLVDAIRKRVWSDRRVEPWYQQNLVLYASDEAIAASEGLRREHEQTFPGFLSIVHPRLYGPLLERAGVKPAGPWRPDASATAGAAKRGG